MRTSASDHRLVVDGLAAGYGAVPVLRGVSLRVEMGEFVCLLGANGAGKTTLMRSIVGHADVTAGVISFEGRPLVRHTPYTVTRSGVAIVPEGRALVPDLSVRDNLLLGSVPWNRHFRSADLAAAMQEIFDRFPVLGSRRDQAAGSLSGGEQQMLAIGRALISRPRLLLLDEPSLGLAPMLVRRVFDDLAVANRAGLTILVAEQNAAAALRVAHRCVVMSGGRIVSEGTADALRESPEVRRAFLGIEHTKPSAPEDRVASPPPNNLRGRTT